MSSVYTGIQYMGCVGSSDSCKRAVMEIIQFGRTVLGARLLTFEGQHCFLLQVDNGDLCLIRAGFTSGYRGEGPSALSYVLRLLDAHKISIQEYKIDEELFERANNALLTLVDLETLEKLKPVRPMSKWYDYIYDCEEEKPRISWETILSEYELEESKPNRNGRGISLIPPRNNPSELWEEFPSILPYSLIDYRITDLALGFQESPDESLLSGYRRLEGILRSRTGLHDLCGSKLFSKCFIDETCLLYWEGLSKAECKGRGNLFKSIYSSFRNPRAHHEEPNTYKDCVAEFIILNQLYKLEKEAVEAPKQPE